MVREIELMYRAARKAAQFNGMSSRFKVSGFRPEISELIF